MIIKFLVGVDVIRMVVVVDQRVNALFVGDVGAVLELPHQLITSDWAEAYHTHVAIPVLAINHLAICRQP